MSNTWGFRPNKLIFTPASIAGLDLWLDATLGVTQAGNRVTGWADQSGLGHNLSAAGAARPNYSATGNGVGGPFLQGDNTAMWMGASWTEAQPVHLFIVAKWNPSNAAFHDLCDGWVGNSGRIFADTTATPGLHLMAGNDRGGFVAPALNAWQIYEAKFNSTNSLLNIAQTSVLPNGDSGATSPGGISLWTFGQGGGNFSDAQIVSVVRYSNILGASDRAALVSYLQSTWAAT